jgi:hypothetical protein
MRRTSKKHSTKKGGFIDTRPNSTDSGNSLWNKFLGIFTPATPPKPNSPEVNDYDYDEDDDNDKNDYEKALSRITNQMDKYGYIDWKKYYNLEFTKMAKGNVSFDTNRTVAIKYISHMPEVVDKIIRRYDRAILGKKDQNKLFKRLDMYFKGVITKIHEGQPWNKKQSDMDYEALIKTTHGGKGQRINAKTRTGGKRNKTRTKTHRK